MCDMTLTPAAGIFPAQIRHSCTWSRGCVCWRSTRIVTPTLTRTRTPPTSLSLWSSSSPCSEWWVLRALTSCCVCLWVRCTWADSVVDWADSVVVDWVSTVMYYTLTLTVLMLHWRCSPTARLSSTDCGRRSTSCWRSYSPCTSTAWTRSRWVILNRHGVVVVCSAHAHAHAAFCVCRTTVVLMFCMSLLVLLLMLLLWTTKKGCSAVIARLEYTPWISCVLSCVNVWSYVDVCQYVSLLSPSYGNEPHCI